MQQPAAPFLHVPAGAWLPTFIVLLALSTLVPTLANVDWTVAWDAGLFVVLAACAHLLLAALLCCLPGWACSLWRPLHRLTLPVIGLFAGLWLILVLVDARVFQLFGFHLNGLVMSLLMQAGLLDQLGLGTGAWLLIGVLLVVLALVLWGVLRSLRAAHWPRRLRPRYLLVLVPLLLASNALAIWYDANRRGDALVAVQAVPWIATPTARSALVRWGLAQPRDGASDGLQSTDRTSGLAYPRRPLQCRPAASPNVLMIVVDSLRHDMLTAAQMPNAFQFAATAWQGQQHYSTGNNTMHGMFGLFYGLPALHVEAMIHNRRGPELVHQLQEHGYGLHLYGGASLSGARLDRAVFVDVQAPLLTAPDDTPQDQRDAYVVGELQKVLRERRGQWPFFAMVLLDSAHVPYAVPPGAELPFMPQAESGAHLRVGRTTDPTPLFNRYRNAVLNTDHYIGQLLQTLAEAGLDKDTVVIITSDHGESFNDLGQNDWGHNSNFSDDQVRVPMLIRWPGRAPYKEPSITSHMDLAPTLLTHLLGCANPLPDYTAGLDLFSPLPAARPLLVESWTSRAVRLGPQTLLLRPFGVEVRDARYRRVEDVDALDPEVNAAILRQVQLLR